jgi:hypothetical protein
VPELLFRYILIAVSVPPLPALSKRPNPNRLTTSPHRHRPTYSFIFIFVQPLYGLTLPLPNNLHPSHPSGGDPLPLSLPYLPPTPRHPTRLRSTFLTRHETVLSPFWSSVRNILLLIPAGVIMGHHRRGRFVGWCQCWDVVVVVERETPT